MDSAVQGTTAASDRTTTSGRRTKSAGAFRTISEVAEELDVAQHVLRFWESKFPQVRPLKRGGGRRYYRPEDVDLLRRIRSLLYEEGYTIKGAQKLLKGQRRPSADRIDRDCVEQPEPTRQNDVDAVAGVSPSVAAEAPLRGLNAEQRQSLAMIRSDLASLRDSLKKFRS